MSKKQSAASSTSNYDGSDLVLVEGGNWVKNEKIKTCKCETCGERVKKWSYKCMGCWRHVCSECLNLDSDERSDYQHRAARNHVEEGCWHRFARQGNMHPAFAAYTPPPPMRLEEEARARASKQLANATKAAKAQGLSKQKPPPANKSRESSESAAGEPDSDFVGPSTISDTLKAKPVTRKRKLNLTEPYDSDDTGSPPEDNGSKVAKLMLRRRGSASVAARVSGLFAEPVTDLGTFPKTADGSVATNVTVVGAGFVGLFVARELALEVKKRDIPVDITVVDVRDGHCQLASGYCNGLLSADDGLPEGWDSLAQLSKEAWLEILSLPDTKQELSFSTTTPLKVALTGSQSLERCPSWLKGTDQASFELISDSIGRIETSKLASWLLAQCQILGVSFEFGNTVSSTTFDDQARLESIRLTNHEQEDKELLCTQLVLAAGPFTTRVFDQLFPGHPVTLQNNVYAAHWFTVPSDIDSTPNDVAVHIPKCAANERRLQDIITVVPYATDSTIKVTAFGAGLSNDHLPSEDARRARHGKTKELRALTAPYLNHDGLDVNDKRQVQGSGRSELSVANGGAPIIDRVPASALGLSDATQESGVWLCYGFGQYGTFLARGAAGLLVTKMFGGGQEVEDFCLPPYERSDLESQDKGKGKATV